MFKNDLEFDQATFIDVRTEREYSRGHLEGAINIPLDEIFSRIEEIKSMHKPLILYCRSGSRSQMALEILKAQGIDNIYDGGGLDSVKKFLN